VPAGINIPIYMPHGDHDRNGSIVFKRFRRSVARLNIVEVTTNFRENGGFYRQDTRGKRAKTKKNGKQDFSLDRQN
jgi:hypothetical protein